MQIHWQEGALALTPESERDSALLDALAAAHRPVARTRTPPPNTVEPTTSDTGKSPS
jgi:hypothetical protein